jgi:hypothetical protein
MRPSFADILIMAVVLLSCCNRLRAGPLATPAPTPDVPPMSMFQSASNLQITTTLALLVDGKPAVEYTVVYDGFQGDKGYDYSEALRPDPDPGKGDERDDVNLFYENGEVKEENAKDHSWVRYPCDKDMFMNWLNYRYSGAGIIMGVAQYVLQHPEKFTVTDNGSTVTYRPKMETSPDPDITVFKSLTFNKTPPILLQEIVLRSQSDPQHSSTRMRFSYSVANFDYGDAFNPPVYVKKVPDRMKARFVWP